MAVSPKSVVGSHGMTATRFLLSAIECRGIRAAGIRIPVLLRRVTDALTTTNSPAAAKNECDMNDEFELWDLRVEVIGDPESFVCRHEIGSHFDVSGENLAFPVGQGQFCTFS